MPIPPIQQTSTPRWRGHSHCAYPLIPSILSVSITPLNLRSDKTPIKTAGLILSLATCTESPYYIPMRTIIHTKDFDRKAQQLWTDDEIGELDFFLANNPYAGDVIPGTGGFRKLRWQSTGRGKRGGARVVYYNPSEEYVLLYTAYEKKNQSDLTNEQRKGMREAKDEN